MLNFCPENVDPNFSCICLWEYAKYNVLVIGLDQELHFIMQVQKSLLATSLGIFHNYVCFQVLLILFGVSFDLQLLLQMPLPLKHSLYGYGFMITQTLFYTVLCWVALIDPRICHCSLDEWGVRMVS